MKPARPSFQNVDIDDIDKRLEQQAAEKGIPSLVVPRAEPVRREEGRREPPVEASREAPADSGMQVLGKKPQASQRQWAGGTPRARMKPVNFEVPDYVWVEMKTKAAQEMVSVRYFLMSALRLKGVRIDDVDLIEDGRRQR